MCFKKFDGYSMITKMANNNLLPSFPRRRETRAKALSYMHLASISVAQSFRADQ